MRLGPRAKLLLIALVLIAPIVASFIAYFVVRPAGTSNYGELLMPPATVTPQVFARMEGGRFAFSELAGKWVMVVSDRDGCRAECVEKLVTLRQVRLALGRNAIRVERVLISGPQAPRRELEKFEGMVVALTLPGAPAAAGPTDDPAHIYLVDPHGNLMMRWPSKPDPRRMLRDLDRLLRASQIG